MARIESSAVPILLFVCSLFLSSCSTNGDVRPSKEEKALLETLESGTDEEKGQAIARLAELESVAAIPKFVELLLEPHQSPRELSLQELKNVRSMRAALYRTRPAGVRVLGELLWNDGKPNLWVGVSLTDLERDDSRRMAAEFVFEKFEREEPSAQLWGSWVYLRGVSSLAPVLPNFRDIVGYTDARGPSLELAARLVELREAAIPTLRTELSAKGSVDPQPLVYLLVGAAIRGKSLADIVEPLLGSDDEIVRSITSEVLVELSAYLQHGLEPGEEFVHPDKPRILATLEKLMKDRSPIIRARASISFARLSAPTKPTAVVQGRLVDALEDRSQFVRTWAAILLVGTREKELSDRNRTRSLTILRESQKEPKLQNGVLSFDAHRMWMPAEFAYELLEALEKRQGEKDG